MPSPRVDAEDDPEDRAEGECEDDRPQRRVYRRKLEAALEAEPRDAGADVAAGDADDAAESGERTASIRNWIRMSQRRAPIALRMPISRVRSVTDTSMMFMMPMPPTSSAMPTTAPMMRGRVQHLEIVFISSSCADLKVVGLSFLEMMTRAQNGRAPAVSRGRYLRDVRTCKRERQMLHLIAAVDHHRGRKRDVDDVVRIAGR